MTDNLQSIVEPDQRIWSGSVSRILYSRKLEHKVSNPRRVTVIHLGGGLLRSLKRPTRRSLAAEAAIGRAVLVTPPYLVLHREEFA